MTDATIEIKLSEYIPLWEKAVKKSMQDMEYTAEYEVLPKPKWKVWEKTKYIKSPMTDYEDYWRVMVIYYPWNTVSGMLSISKHDIDKDKVLHISTYLLSSTLNRAKECE